MKGGGERRAGGRRGLGWQTDPKWVKMVDDTVERMYAHTGRYRGHVYM